MDIDKQSKLPMYAQLFEIITRQISSGELKEGDQLPFERELCEIHSISRTTVRQAMAELEKEGYIYKIHGKGMFVRGQAVKQSLMTVYSFHEEMMRLNRQPSSQILTFELIAPSSAVAQKLQTDEFVYHIIRLRSANADPVLYEETYLVQSHFPGFTREILEQDSLYNVIKEKYNIAFRRAIDTFRAINIPVSIASFLHEKQGVSGLQIERVAFIGLTPVEYTIEIARGSKFEYTIELQGVTMNSAISTV
ncbi:GntR family transcriptional regulator [Pseudocitrobacter corydidari]|uniref:HTH-type transcriptional repressor NagR n=1 Tax=Pseudocitrobacter corydidari TaxID=2891570 RepID=A0ABY3S2C5_9ENTR|nr:GntR family transcriptional regulator [Pseudocitrobacter corydidari]UGS40800.1 HTH-type transcriptional repressor NagR [Pseudocitrobacter corydidari]